MTDQTSAPSKQSQGDVNKPHEFRAMTGIPVRCGECGEFKGHALHSAPSKQSQGLSMPEVNTDRRLTFGTFYALVNGRGELSCIGNDPQIFKVAGPYVHQNAAKRGNRLIRVRIIEARDGD